MTLQNGVTATDELTLSPTLTELTNGMAAPPQMVAVAKASLNNCIMIVVTVGRGAPVLIDCVWFLWALWRSEIVHRWQPLTLMYGWPAGLGGGDGVRYFLGWPSEAFAGTKSGLLAKPGLSSLVCFAILRHTGSREVMWSHAQSREGHMEFFQVLFYYMTTKKQHIE